VKRVVLGLAIILGGCADDPSTLSSGSRLELAWHEFDDGSRQLDTVEIFDAKRGEMCVAREWSDGATYCTPGGRVFASVSEVFTSASCDASVLRAGEGRAMTYVPTFDGGAITALHRAEAVTVDAAWVRDAAGACVGPFATTGQRFYARGAAVTASELTRIEAREIHTGGRVSLRVNASDDGLSVPVGMRDAALGFDCIVRQTSTSAATCLPPRQAALRFSDAACAKPVVGQHASYNDVAPYVFAGEVCAPQGFMVGVEIAAVPGYELVGGACVATTAPIGHRWFEAASIELATMDRRRVTSGGARLDAIEIAAGDVVIDAGNRFDTRTGGECHLASSASEPGVRRCLPQDPGFEHTYYADAACTQAVPLANVYRQAPMAKCGAALPPFAVAADRPGHYLRIMGSESTPVFRRDETGRCTASPMEGLAGTPLRFQMGEEVGVSMFAAARTVR
jgi:hypothetical protein